ncbi:MAG TPA: anaerobic ribonucleoside-triphosphate reductase activating protein [Candidatus Pacearchaeota archaeon]|nr:anaerobic ribonucleoside-triphosphate reductase activating protein [Candidatus Pacearchaeota archaeon]
MLIGGIQKTTLIDYPSKIACTVFLGGCNFHCPFCYNSELVLPEKLKKIERVKEKDFFNFLEQRKGLLEGVCICGGEPTIHTDLPEFIQKIKKMGFLVKLDTNGSNPDMIKKLIKENFLDYIAMDIKAPLNEESYNKAVNVKINLEKIKESVKIIKNSDVLYEFRTTVVPNIHTKEDIIQIAKDISPAKNYFLQNFQSTKNLDSNFEKVKPYDKEFLIEIKKSISSYFDFCEVR